MQSQEEKIGPFVSVKDVKVGKDCSIVGKRAPGGGLHHFHVLLKSAIDIYWAN